jgi:hypothetical protein
MQLLNETLYLTEPEAVQLDTDLELPLNRVLSTAMQARNRLENMYERVELHVRSGDTDRNPDIIRRARIVGTVAKQMLAQPGIVEAAAELLELQIVDYLSETDGGVE